jgi:hypothetical protein
LGVGQSAFHAPVLHPLRALQCGAGVFPLAS